MHIEALLLNKYYTVLFSAIPNTDQQMSPKSRMPRFFPLVFHGGWRTDLQAH